MAEINPPNFNLTELALSLHEFYLSLTNAGFTEEQAMDLLKTTLKQNQG
jgi:hypothetical protein